MNFILYYAAISADAILSALLRREYGSSAGDRRYQYPDHEWEDINVARRQKHAADIAWVNYMRGAA